MAEAIQDPVNAVPDQFASELEAPRWSVISFERREANALAYSDAVRLLDDLDRKGVAGLCVVSDEAASRVSA